MCKQKCVRLVRKFVCMFSSLSPDDATMLSECGSWLCYSIHQLLLVTQVMETCSFSLNISDYFNLTLRTFSTMSCDKVSPLVLVTSCTLYFYFAVLIFLHLLLGKLRTFTLIPKIPCARYSP